MWCIFRNEFLTMKKYLSLLVLLFISSIGLRGQIVINRDMLSQNTNANVKFVLQDSQTKEPLFAASAYLVPAGDTIITHFAMSDDKGRVNLTNVPSGRKYILNVEMLGYISHRKEYSVNTWEVDFGVIEMMENPEYIDAATITALGNQVMMVDDTLIYNAAAFKVGENDMLEDLLKRMPGMEVDESGMVRVNGEPVTNITIGGKTFFFNDPSVALKNLPAKIVERITVVDEKSDDSEFTGIATDDDKEKVMDVELKDEYTKGWFGNAKLGGGVSVNTDRKDELVEDGKFLYNGNAVLSGYSEKDQVVIIANGYNVIEGNSIVVGSIGGESFDNPYTALSGLQSSAQGGVNYNTDRIDNFAVNASAQYKHNSKDGDTRSSRVSYQSSGSNLYTNTSKSGYGIEDVIDVALEFDNLDKKKYTLIFSPTFKYTTNRVNTESESDMFSQESSVNRSLSDISYTNRYVSTDGSFTGGIKNLGKDRRALTMTLNYDFNDGSGQRDEYAVVYSAGESNIQDILYKLKGKSTALSGGITYVEPIGEKWALRTKFNSEYAYSNDEELAYDSSGNLNKYYSSLTKNTLFTEKIHLLVQYNNKYTNLQFGLQSVIRQDVINAKAMDVESIYGKGDWIVNWAPFVNYEFDKNGHEVKINYEGTSRGLSSANLTPTLDITNPVQISTGNIYLRPSFRHRLKTSYDHFNMDKFSLFSIAVHGSANTNQVVYASWYDQGGVRYAVPVNSKSPGLSSSVYLLYNTPFGKSGQFNFSLVGVLNYDANISYQSTKQLPGLDVTSFDYSAFMSQFWGSPNGDVFYSGKSGFGESLTRSLSSFVEAKLKYRGLKIDATLTLETTNMLAKYTLDPTADMNVWNNYVSNDIMYMPGEGWTFSNTLKYGFYLGYQGEYATPEWIWNFSFGKTIKAFTISLSANDVLNQGKNLQHITSAEYAEDTRSTVIGRNFLLNLSFNFGKMNKSRNAQVERTLWDMTY